MGADFGLCIDIKEHSSKVLTNTATSCVSLRPCKQTNKQKKETLAWRTNTFCTSTLLSVGELLNGRKRKWVTVLSRCSVTPIFNADMFNSKAFLYVTTVSRNTILDLSFAVFFFCGGGSLV